MPCKILYLSYDGLSDPLGSAQIIPYLEGLSQMDFEFHVISFEKKDRYQLKEGEIRLRLSKFNIHWYPETFTSSPPLLSKFRDLRQFKRRARQIIDSENPKLIHCRSYVSTLVALKSIGKKEIPVLFDMRGLWVDERVDKKIWHLRNPVYYVLYKYFRKLENKLIRQSDHIICLTESSRDYVLSKWQLTHTKVSVIPCSANIAGFTIPSNHDSEQAKSDLGLPPKSFCLGYLGSLGGWYDLKGMLVFFKNMMAHYENAYFVFFTPFEKNKIIEAASQFDIPQDRIRVRFIEPTNLNEALDAFDLSILFIDDVFSKIACSPARISELWGKGIPVVLNRTIGDIDAELLKGKGFFENEFFDMIPQEISDKKEIRKFAGEYFNLAKAVKAYSRIYSNLLHP